MKTLQVSKQTAQKLKQGRCLLLEKDFPRLPSEDGVVSLYDPNNQLLGTAYLAKQNKGLGWFLSEQLIDLDRDYFCQLFEQAKVRRQSYLESNVTTAYRLFNQEGDGFGGLTIDCYGDYALFSWYNDFVYTLAPVVVEAFRAVFPNLLGGYEKIRFQGLNYESAHLYGQEAPDVFHVLENGVRYQVFLNDGLMTGIFLDQHEVRGSLVDGLAAGKTLLNMFSYTAAFSVAAAMGGASSTTSVDLAKRSRDLSTAHFVANHLDTEHHQFVVMDVFDYFRYAKRKGLTFDVIVLDPPSFARNKKRTFSVAKDYYRLIEDSLPLLNKGGLIIASTNASNVSVEQFRKQLDKGLVGVNHQYLALQQLPVDFRVNSADPSSNYLKVFTIQVNQ
ncbi:class I SAM-dependent rRNA methyltransferase [Streptococcus sp. sy004]|uniref:class I SAM-dependent rRNA methyltransferase n=1 Tax=Streptococcus sp. sy004 TaxID=2600149 RepID=UPI0011B49656|nr:class I SAM-dependent rRNA methyltransferase [Streptococcus sp. sy004]TWT12445.1 class I SAM-dependent rRNA methyltransferase [Streptococcus sp. sy004]